MPATAPLLRFPTSLNMRAAGRDKHYPVALRVADEKSSLRQRQ
uniref:Uncharacterized protein n=1 Tax=Erwinia amylovora ATCC BAA-2158 TaxID=889211 RepID=E5B8Z3_ERWAM|nr:hypothetical protein predicted by Glimmer/Critica [Erwinia amylovora ATCC BAA-2158]